MKFNIINQYNSKVNLYIIRKLSHFFINLSYLTVTTKLKK